MAFELAPATAADVATMGKVFAAAFATDTHTLIKMEAKGEGMNELEHMMDGALEPWIQHPQRAVTKAVEVATGKVAGWVCWGYHGYEETPANPGTQQPQEQQSDDTEIAVDPNPEVTEEDKTKDPIERLESITNGDMDRWIKKVMPKGVKCMYICAITVHPAYQGRGVGSALIRKGTTEADKDGVFCWVHSSEAGHRTFAKEGFEEKEKLEVDLDEFASTPPAGKDKWGTYTFRYMLRPAKQ